MSTRPFDGRWLVAASAVGVGTLCAAILAVPEVGNEEIRAVIRVTALTSSAFFLLAFTTSALHRLRPTDASRWLLAHRRYLGLSFAVSHLFHALAIAALVRRAPSFLPTVATATLVGGGLGFGFIALMAATSTDAAVRLLGPKAWRALHTTGIYYLWFVFLFTYMGPATHSVFHALMTAVFAGAWTLRLFARASTPRD